METYKKLVEGKHERKVEEGEGGVEEGEGV